MNYKTIIGLEVHIELSTASKMFCRCSADHFAKKPNTQTCPTCLGLPGALPAPNKKAIEDTILMGTAFGCSINLRSKFDRKHYFYPDLPKGYQISQYDEPLCVQGAWTNKAGQTFNIRRIHLEEDTAKLQHGVVNGKKVTLVDFNRSGVPLMEMVTDPDFQNPEDVSEFLKEVQAVVRSLGISSGDMEKGSMRLEANISLANEEESAKMILPNYKVELKNINSFKFLQKALEAEIARQTELLQKGEKIVQETRGYDQIRGVTFSQRVKEDAHDYRYFPEPDIPPIELTIKDVEQIKLRMTELPKDKRKRFVSTFGIPESYADIFVQNSNLGLLFELSVEAGHGHGVGPKTIADYLINKKSDSKEMSAQEVIISILKITKKDYLSEDETTDAVLEVLGSSPKQIDDYKNGKTGLLGFFIGQVQARLKGKGDPMLIKKVLEKKLYE